MKILSPSILAYDVCDISGGVGLIKQTSAEWVHIDVMDGLFVPKITFGQSVIAGIKKLTSQKLDVHLMTQFPEKLVPSMVLAGADIITFHAESSSNILNTINLIKSYGKMAGLAINPSTSVYSITEILPLLDMVLVMGVIPGECGQAFLPGTYGKLSTLSNIKSRPNSKFLIGVDGGVNSRNFDKICLNGAEVFVVGSAFFSETDFFNRAFKKG